MASVQPFVPKTAGRYDHLVLPDGRIHRSLYTDPQIFEDEMVKIFGGSWVFLLHESEIARLNDFKTITVGRRPTIVARTAEGRIVAMLNRCTHRGSPVVLAASGNARSFVCPYHGWTYANSGDLASVSFPAGYGPQFDLKAHALGRLPRVESYRGYVFGSLNAEVEPLLDWLGPAREHLDWSIDRDGAEGTHVRVVESIRMTYKGNWKHQNDNNTDGYHTPFLHAATNKMNRLRHGSGKWLSHVNDQTDMVCQYLGHGHKLGDHRPELKSAWRQSRPVPGRETFSERLIAQAGEEKALEQLELVGRAGINLVIYPNLFIMGNGTFAVFEPVAVDLTNIRYFGTLIGDAPEEVNQLRVRFEEDFHNVGSRDDSEIQELVQHTLAVTPEMEWLDVSRGMCRQTIDERGVITSNKTDDTAIRGGYDWWRTLMNRDVRTTVV